MSVIILVADGARPDTLAAAMDAGALPHLARLRAEGGMHAVTTVWPSVTGVAYVPFLMGRYPGDVGLPGLRWLDRTRARGRWTAATRSYVGWGMRHVDRDVAPEAPTLFELAGSSLGALEVLGRGLRPGERLGRDARFVARAARTHFTGDLHDWLAIDREMGAEVARRLRRAPPRVTFAAFTGIDKASHATGHDSPLAHAAMQAVDAVAGELRADAEAAGRWETTHLWVVSDHGHAPVTAHDDLAELFAGAWGFRTLSHPWVLDGGADVAVMVSGNAMAHLYLEPARRARPFWPALRGRWHAVVDALLARPSVDLLVLPMAPHVAEVRGRGRGAARITRHAGGYWYEPLDGDPLGIGPVDGASSDEAYDVTRDSDYPDALVQVSHLCASSRAGDVLLSAAPGWDFRRRYEPIPHRSTHGALHREQMLAPLLVNRPAARPPRRTVDVMPSALQALGLPCPAALDGAGWLVADARLAQSGSR